MCKYCKETSCIDYASYDCKHISEGKIDSIEARVRMDIRPEDELYQIDSEVVAIVGDKVYGKWSDTALNINYCPMCGRKLREQQEALWE